MLNYKSESCGRRFYNILDQLIEMWEKGWQVAGTETLSEVPNGMQTFILPLQGSLLTCGGCPSVTTAHKAASAV